MLSFYLIWSLSYFTLLWWMGRFWKEKGDAALSQSFYPPVTLIIPFRNEVKNLSELCLNLRKLTYPNLEILLIDDHSEDDSFELLRRCFDESQSVQLLKCPNQGKKAALEFGVMLASGEIILCSDADCNFPEFWVENMVLPFNDAKIQLVAGPVMVKEKGKFLEAFQSLDWASILLVTKYSFAQKEPLMCSGANLAYRKEAFLQVSGYEGNREFASGDDEFLLKRIHSNYGKVACRYLSSPDVLVETSPEPSWRDLINQRVRWASKWKAHSSFSHLLSAGGAFLIQVIWLGSFYLFSFGGKGILVFVLVWLVKIAAEKLSLGKVLKSFTRKPVWLAFIQTSFVHPFYVLRVGMAALSGKFTWKGREN